MAVLNIAERALLRDEQNYFDSLATPEDEDDDSGFTQPDLQDDDDDAREPHETHTPAGAPAPDEHDALLPDAWMRREMLFDSGTCQFPSKDACGVKHLSRHIIRVGKNPTQFPEEHVTIASIVKEHDPLGKMHA